jgi:hypothetical protein
MPGSEREVARRALAYSSAVFAGEVVSITKGEPTPRSDTISFRVSEVWKGPEQDTLEVTSSTNDGISCGFPFEEGQEYLVYAHGQEQSLKNPDCGQTTPLSEANADLEALDYETLGGSGAVLSDTSGGFPPLGVMGVMGGAVAVVSLAVLMRLVRTS